MKIKVLDCDFSICKIKDCSNVKFDGEYCFVGKTDEEISLTCITGDAPTDAIERDDGWKAFRIQGVLDFSLIGILSKISALLAANGIGIFAISTYNTDYIFTKREDFTRALEVLAAAGYEIA